MLHPHKVSPFDGNFDGNSKNLHKKKHKKVFILAVFFLFCLGFFLLLKRVHSFEDGHEDGLF